MNNSVFSTTKLHKLSYTLKVCLQMRIYIAFFKYYEFVAIINSKKEINTCSKTATK